MQIYYINNNQI